MVRPLSDRRAEALEDRSPRPDRVWNRIPDDVPGQIVQLALDEPKPSPRELATRFRLTNHRYQCQKINVPEGPLPPGDLKSEG